MAPREISRNRIELPETIKHQVISFKLSSIGKRHIADNTTIQKANKITNKAESRFNLDGGGAKPGAVDWLRDACDQFNIRESSISGRRIDLMNMTEFVQWANSIFK
ncbi:PD-(D/E)XK nuclease superfamily protein [Legionella yabuuchiae]|uniref:PD-(D/E)XK nuclease superfamily protein n=1 Tax=Legionella yabuuchiae TaxID=376727 RepID=UPI001F5F1C4C|nr:PD-(D/E)XK nuclease superfamily protein [Legionella yabuuchiae]